MAKQPAQERDQIDPKALEDAIAKLTPEEAAFFLATIEKKLRKRKIQLTGYLVALPVWLLGMFGALLYHGSRDGFTAWIFLVPFALLGIILYLFGTWATKVGGPDVKRPHGAAEPK